jgi:hypothetical protein
MKITKLKMQTETPAKSIKRKQNTSEIPESAGSNADDGHVPERFSTDLDSGDESKSQNYVNVYGTSNGVWSPNYSNAAVADDLSSAPKGDFERKNSKRQNFSTQIEEQSSSNATHRFPQRQ